jgi:hypothetical protein
MNKITLLFLFLGYTSFSQNIGITSVATPINNQIYVEEETTDIRMSVGFLYGVPLIIENMSSDTQTLYYQLNDGVIYEQDIIVSLGILTPPLSPSNGYNSLRIWFDAPEDINPNDDELIVEFYYCSTSTTPWNETIETLTPNGAIDTQCWEVKTTDYIGDEVPFGTTWSIGDYSTINNTSVPTPINGNKFFYPDLHSNIGHTAELISPYIDISNLTLAELSFDYHTYGRFETPVEIEIFTNGNWESIGLLEDTIQLERDDPWKKRRAYLNGITGTIRLKFKYTDPDYVSWYQGPYETDHFTAIDNILIQEAPTCPQPSKITIDRFNDITTDTALISWNHANNETMWQLEYGVSGFSPGTGTSMIIGVNSHQLTGLNSGTQYDVYINAVCDATPGVNDSSAIMTSFETVCVYTAPWNENLESHTSTTRSSIENCWKTDAYDSHDYRWNILNQGETTLNPYEGNNYLRNTSSFLNNTLNSGQEKAAILSPYININSLSSPAMSFYYHMYLSGVHELSLDVYSNNTWHNDFFVIAGEQQASVTDQWSYALIDLSSFSGEIRLRFNGIAGGDDLTFGDGTPESSIAIDDISVDEMSVLSTKNTTLTSSLVYYPTPTKNKLHLKSKTIIEDILVFNTIGQNVKNFTAINKTDAELDISTLKSGLYFVKIKGSNYSNTIRILKE